MIKKLYASVCLWAIVSSMMLLSCREESDTLSSYSYTEQDTSNFDEASSSFEEQFKAIWTAMNCNYPIWDYEEEHGVDWDQVYRDYLPRFRVLDERARTLHDSVSNSELRQLYDEIFSPLHDGHFYAGVLNLHNGSTIWVWPNAIRKGIRYVLEGKEFGFYYIGIGGNDGFPPTTDYMEDSYGSKYACFQDNIIYLKLKNINLSDLIEDESSQLHHLWYSWFNKIQLLSNNNALNGLIIDLRDNTGGNAHDQKYILGALQSADSEFWDSNGNPIKGYKIGQRRIKSGPGRRDYLPLMSEYAPIYQEEHAEINDAPIVILANKYTGSAAERMCLFAKQMKNGYVIGEQTFGALSPLLPNHYSLTYAGSVGHESLAPFYLNIPMSAFFTNEGEILESVGIKPDIEVELDDHLYFETGRDTQLERALEFIRTGK